MVRATAPSRAALIFSQSTKAFSRVRVLVDGVTVAADSFWGTAA